MKESSQGTLQIFSCMRKMCSFRKTPYFPPGHSSLGALQLRKQQPPRRLDRRTDGSGRDRRATLPPPGGPMAVSWRCPWYLLFPNTPLPDEVLRP